MILIRSILTDFQEGWRAFFFPRLCFACGARVCADSTASDLQGGLFCVKCRSGVRLLDGVMCPCCGQPGVSMASKCRRCLGAFQGFHRAAAGAAYSGTVRDLVLRFKFGRQRGMVHPLAMLAVHGAQHALLSHSVDCILPIPLHPARQRSRGFNQAELMALQMAPVLGLPCLKGVVYRTRNTLPQGLGGRGARRANVRGAFAPVRDGLNRLLKGEFPGRAVSGRHVLLVDDVLSTGATMDACGRVLLEAGALSVTGAAAAT